MMNLTTTWTTSLLTTVTVKTYSTLWTAATQPVTAGPIKDMAKAMLTVKGSSSNCSNRSNRSNRSSSSSKAMTTALTATVKTKDTAKKATAETKATEEPKPTTSKGWKSSTIKIKNTLINNLETLYMTLKQAVIGNGSRISENAESYVRKRLIPARENRSCSIIEIV